MYKSVNLKTINQSKQTMSTGMQSQPQPATPRYNSCFDNLTTMSENGADINYRSTLAKKANLNRNLNNKTMNITSVHPTAHPSIHQSVQHQTSLITPPNTAPNTAGDRQERLYAQNMTGEGQVQDRYYDVN